MFVRKHYAIPVLAAACALLGTGLWTASTRKKNDAAPAVRASSPDAAPTTAELRGRLATTAVDGYPALMRLILQSKNPSAREEMTADLIGRWLNADRESFAAFLDEAEIEGESIWSRLAPGMIAALARLDPKVAETSELQDLLARVIVKFASHDPAQALAWAREHLKETRLDTALAGIAGELVKTDADAAIALVAEITAMPNRMEATEGIGRILGASDPERGLEWARSFTHETEKAFALSSVLTGLSGHDPERAASEYAAIVEAMREKYREMVTADRTAAGTTPEEEYEGLPAEEILKAELAKPNPNLIHLEKAAYAIAISLTRQNPERAVEWAKSLDAYQGRGTAMDAILTEWAATAPQAALQAYLRDSGRAPELAERFFGAWAEADAKSASTAALGLPAGVERDSAVEGVTRGWIDSGTAPGQVAKWSEQLANPSERDRLHAVVAAESAYENPVFAWQQLQQMRNSPKRSELFNEIFPSLVEKAPKTAREALSSFRLSQVEKEYFASMLTE